MLGIYAVVFTRKKFNAVAIPHLLMIYFTAQDMLEELNAEIARVAKEGFDAAYFTRAKRASLGARLRALEDFDNVCVSLAMDHFDGYCSFDSFDLLESITAEDCRRFVEEALAPERLAMSVIAPKTKEAAE